MNLSKLFDMQKALDEKIELEKPPQPGEDRLAKKILALQVELGELANEWRGFKFWSKNQQPNIYEADNCKWCKGSGIQIGFGNETGDCEKCNGAGLTNEREPLLEEYVDCLHFILGIGLELELPTNHGYYTYDELEEGETLITLFQRCFDDISKYTMYRDVYDITELIRDFLSLGTFIGFTWEQIEQAYMEKNSINHSRQANGY